MKKNYISPICEGFLTDQEQILITGSVIISSGAAVAVPFFWIGKLHRAKTIYIEVFDRIDKSTLTGKLVYPVTDKFIVQWEEMKKVYKKAENFGCIF